MNPANGLTGRRFGKAGQRLREASDRWRFKQSLQRQIGFEDFTDARHQLQGEQRMSAEPEEIVFDANIFQSQHFLPEFREPHFRFVARWSDGDCRLSRASFRFQFRQRVAIHFAVGRQRQRAEKNKMTRHHEVRKPSGEIGSQRFGRSGVVGTTDNVSRDFFIRGSLIGMPEALKQKRLLRGRELVNTFGGDHGFI